MLEKMQLPALIGHRGLRGHAPENTLAGFRASTAFGLAWFECDIRLCADGTVIVLHDASIDRTTNGTGLAAALSFDELQQYDAGSYFSPQYANQRIPSLQQVLAIAIEFDCRVNLEFKSEGCQPALVENTLVTINQLWPEYRSKLLFSSFDLTMLVALHELDQHARIGLLIDNWQQLQADWLEQANRVNALSIHVNEQQLTQERVATIHRAGYECMAYTVNLPERAKLLRSWGVDCLVTDYPDRVSTD